MPTASGRVTMTNKFSFYSVQLEQHMVRNPSFVLESITKKGNTRWSEQLIRQEIYAFHFRVNNLTSADGFTMEKSTNKFYV